MGDLMNPKRPVPGRGPGGGITGATGTGQPGVTNGPITPPGPGGGGLGWEQPWTPAPNPPPGPFGGGPTAPLPAPGIGGGPTPAPGASWTEGPISGTRPAPFGGGPYDPGPRGGQGSGPIVGGGTQGMGGATLGGGPRKPPGPIVGGPVAPGPSAPMLTTGGPDSFAPPPGTNPILTYTPPAPPPPPKPDPGGAPVTQFRNQQRSIAAPRIPPMKGGSNSWQGQNAPQGGSFTPPPSVGLNPPARKRMPIR